MGLGKSTLLSMTTYLMRPPVRIVDGTLIQAWAGHKSVVPKASPDDEDTPADEPPAPNDNKYVAIQADNRKIMQMTVTTLVDIAKKQGGKYKAVLLMGDLGDNNAVQRRDGALDVLDANKDLVEVVSRVATEWNADRRAGSAQPSAQRTARTRAAH